MARRVVTYIVLVVLLAVLGLTLAFPENAREYRLYLLEKRPSLDLPYDKINQTWTEADLARQFPQLTFRCYANAPGEYRGDRSCFADIGAFNGHKAMNASFYFLEGRLTELSINVPWWGHQAAYKHIEKSFGTPLASQTEPIKGVRLHGWKLENGSSVFYNRDGFINPFDYNQFQFRNPVDWSSAYWKSARSCAAQRCWRPD